MRFCQKSALTVSAVTFVYLRITIAQSTRRFLVGASADSEDLHRRHSDRSALHNSVEQGEEPLDAFGAIDDLDLQGEIVGDVGKALGRKVLLRTEALDAARDGRSGSTCALNLF